jgi:hypothetical protein
MRGVAPSQSPKSAHRKDDGEQRGHANREDRPHEEEAIAVLADVGADSRTSHVQNRDAQPKQRCHYSPNFLSSP